MKAWILTREINEYDQDGEYFVAVFRSKPSHEILEDILNIDPYYGKKLIEHILAGGGRRDNEHEWYHLRHVEYSN
jgi:hypothetical protein